MRRTDFTGDIWPDETQELLLRTALLPPAASAAAWAAARPRIDVHRLPGELHRLIPLLSKTLAAQGVDDPELPRLKGVYQFSWYRNQLLLADGAALVAALEAAGVRTMLLRGAAMALAHHRDVGVRPMNDLDLLVPPDQVGRGRQVAGAEGWRTTPATEPLERREAAATLRNDEGRVVRLHWQPSRNVSLRGAAREALWRRSAAASVNRASTRVPSAADHVVLACIDGARANSGSTLRWITDAVLLMRTPGLDWDVVVAEARRHHVSLLIGEALRYLVQALDADVPGDVLAELAATPTTARDRLAHRLSLTTSRRVPSAAEVLGRFTRLTADLPLPGAVASAPAFLQVMLGVQRRRDLPVAVARKAVRAVVSPPPPLAELSRAGRPGTTGS
jgi:hypothetical protein